MNEIDPLTLKKRLQQDNPPALLDVRTANERRAFHIGGLHIPLHELPSRLAELDPDQEWVVYCHSGIRSAQAVQFLQVNDFDTVSNLIGGVSIWSD